MGTVSNAVRAWYGGALRRYDHYSRKIFNRDLDKYAAQASSSLGPLVGALGRVRAAIHRALILQSAGESTGRAAAAARGRVDSQ